MRTPRATVILLAIVLAFLPAQATVADNAPDRPVAVPVGRLPHTVTPLHYRLDLTVLPDTAGLSGTADIDIDIPEAVDHFYLHGRNLEVRRAAVVANGQSYRARYRQVDASGVALITLPRTFSGNVSLHFEYRAPFSHSLEGAYTAKVHGRAYVFTQFEAISARDVFPGFDEPVYKTPFDLSFRIRQSDTAIANTPQMAAEILGNGLKRVQFATTKPLPTYLVAFAVGDFDVVSGEPLPPNAVRDRPLPLRAITVKGRGQDAQFALEHTGAIVEALERYFQIPYPYAKLDILAVPDFAAGAMENAGAITYRDSIVLIGADANPQRKRRFYYVHAHELAHQWFGDMVTPAWWDDIWLNEAFATWMGYVALDLWQPQQHYRRELSSRGAEVMNLDSKVSARQIRQPVADRHDIADAFDGITYAKGGAVLGMFESYLGREAFRAGVQSYLHRHAWKSATAGDFIDALASQAGPHGAEEVKLAFASFLEQPGLPLVRAELKCESGGNRLQLSQTRYLPLGSKGSGARTWRIPVCIKTGADDKPPTKTCHMLSGAEQSFDLPGGVCPDYLMPNADDAGYYRWTLPGRGWQTLLAHSDALGVKEKLSLAASLKGAFDSGAIDIPAYMGLARRLAAEKDWRIATTPLATMRFIYDRIATRAQRQRLQDRFAALYGGMLDRVGLGPPRDIDTARSQATLVEFLALKARLPALRERLLRIAYDYTGYPGASGLHRQGANTNLLATALTVAVQEDPPGRPFSRYLQDLALVSDDAVFRGRALTALGAGGHPGASPELLQLTVSAQLHDNEIYDILYPQLRDEATREAAWDWLRRNFDALLARIPDWRKGRLAGAGAHFCDAAHRAEVEAFFRPQITQLSGAPRALANALESIDLCMAKKAFHEPGLNRYLAQ